MKWLIIPLSRLDSDERISHHHLCQWDAKDLGPFVTLQQYIQPWNVSQPWEDYCSIPLFTRFLFLSSSLDHKPSRWINYSVRLVAIALTVFHLSNVIIQVPEIENLILRIGNQIPRRVVPEPAATYTAKVKSLKALWLLDSRKSSGIRLLWSPNKCRGV